MSGGRELRITVAGCPGGAAYALLWGGDLVGLEEVAAPECPRDPGVQLAALTMALVDAARLRAARVEITLSAALAIAARRSIAGLPLAPGPAAEAWKAYRGVVLPLLERFDSWEIREGGDLDPTYAALERLCERAAARVPQRRDRAVAALVCTGTLSGPRERTSLGEGVRL
jgi:hypothetical protein